MACNDQSGSSQGFFLKVIPGGRRDNPVFQNHAVDGDWLKQMFKHFISSLLKAFF